MKSATSSTTMIIEESSNNTALMSCTKNEGKCHILESSRGITKKTRSRKNAKKLEEKFKKIDFGYQDMNFGEDGEQKDIGEQVTVKEEQVKKEQNLPLPSVLFGDIVVDNILQRTDDSEVLNKILGENKNNQKKMKKNIFCFNKRVSKVIIHKQPNSNEDLNQSLQNDFTSHQDSQNSEKQQFQQENEINYNHIQLAFSTWDKSFNLHYLDNSFEYEDQQLFFEDPFNNQLNNLIFENNLFQGEQQLNIGNASLIDVPYSQQFQECPFNHANQREQSQPKSPQPQQQYQGLKLLSISLESLTQPGINTFDIGLKNLMSLRTKTPDVVELIKELESAKIRVASLQYHFNQVKCFLSRECCLEEIMQKRQENFDKVCHQILQSQYITNNKQINNKESSAMFYIKTSCNYMTETVENTEIGLSKELLSILKMTKHVQEFIGSIKRGNLPKIFSKNTSRKLQFMLLREIGNKNTTSQENNISFSDTIQSFDHIDIPVTVSIKSIPIVFNPQNHEIPLMSDRLLIIEVKITENVRNEMNELRCRMQKKQSFRYRTLFPTMNKRKQCIDKLMKHTQNQLIKSKQYTYIQHFYQRYYPQQLQHIEEELNGIKQQLIEHSSQKKQLSPLIQAIIPQQ